MFNSSYFRSESHFEDDGTQDYLVFQPIYRFFKKIGNTNHISAWKTDRLSDESIENSATSENSLAPSLN